MKSTRDGKDYDARFGVRQTGEGPYAWTIGRRFEIAARKLGFSRERLSLRSDLFSVPGRETEPVQLAFFEGIAPRELARFFLRGVTAPQAGWAQRSGLSAQGGFHRGPRLGEIDLSGVTLAHPRHYLAHVLDARGARRGDGFLDHLSDLTLIELLRQEG